MKVYVIYETNDPRSLNGVGEKYRLTGEEFIGEESEVQKFVDYLNKRVRKEEWFKYEEKEKFYYKNLNEAKINYLKRRIEQNLKELDEIETLNLFDLLPSAKETNEQNIYFSIEDAEKIKNAYLRESAKGEKKIPIEIASQNNQKIKINMDSDLFNFLLLALESGYYKGVHHGNLKIKIRRLKKEIDEDSQELSSIENGTYEETEQE